MNSVTEKYINDHTDDISPILSELMEETEELTGLSRWSIGKVEGKLLQMLVKISGASNVIEIGTFTGFSAMVIAEALPEEGSIVTCEASNEYAAIASRYFARSPYTDKIELRLAPAMETLSAMPDGCSDFVFIDADKPSYGQYYDEAIRLLRSGGVIFVDNVFWRQKIFKQPITNENAIAIAAFNEKVNCDDRVEKVMLNVRDGIYLIRKK